MSLLSQKYSAKIEDNNLHDMAATHPFEEKLLHKDNPYFTLYQTLSLIQLSVVTAVIETKIQQEISPIFDKLKSDEFRTYLKADKRIEADIAYLQTHLTYDQSNLIFVSNAANQYADYLKQLEPSRLFAHWYTLTLATMFGGAAIKNLTRHKYYPGQANNKKGASYYMFTLLDVLTIRTILDDLNKNKIIDENAFLEETPTTFKKVIFILDELDTYLNRSSFAFQLEKNKKSALIKPVKNASSFGKQFGLWAATATLIIATGILTTGVIESFNTKGNQP